MKKILLLSSSLFVFTIASRAQIRIGIVAGSSLSNQSRNDFTPGKLVSNKAFKGYHIGAVADLPITTHFYLQPQLVYSKKGSKYTAAFGTDAKLTMHSIEMPLNLLYKVDMPFGKIFAGAGPVLSYGFAGKLENNGDSKKLYSGAAKDWNRLDLSANAITGVEFNNGFYASIGYQRGFRDINKTAAATVKNRSVSLSVGYFINWKKGKA